MPSVLIAIGLAVSLFLLYIKKQRAGKILLLVILIFYYILFTAPVSKLIAWSLINNVNVKSDRIIDKDSQAIVILSAGVQIKPFKELSGTSWRRLWQGIEEYRKFKGNVPVIYSGGSPNYYNDSTVEAKLAKEYAVSMNIPENMFWIDTASGNTHESGINVKRILDNKFPGIDKHKIILVTSALHMLRSVNVMKKNGIHVIPSPADFPMGSLSFGPASLLPSVTYFSISTLSIHEWMGISYYWLLGRI